MKLLEKSGDEEQHSTKPKTIEELQKWIETEGYELQFGNQSMDSPTLVVVGGQQV